jgi:hypothetical protein
MTGTAKTLILHRYPAISALNGTLYMQLINSACESDYASIYTREPFVRKTYVEYTNLIPLGYSTPMTDREWKYSSFMAV